MAKQSIEYGKRSAMSFRPQDRELWEIVSNVPRLVGPWPYIVAIFCIVLPGSGTILSACVGFKTSWSKTQIFVGVLQMMTAIYLIGWIWSIWWGLKILHKALKEGQQEQ